MIVDLVIALITLIAAYLIYKVNQSALAKAREIETWKANLVRDSSFPQLHKLVLYHAALANKQEELKQRFKEIGFYAAVQSTTITLKSGTSSENPVSEFCVTESGVIQPTYEVHGER